MNAGKPLKKDAILAKTVKSMLSNDRKSCWYGLAGVLGLSGLLADWLSDVDAAAFEAFLDSSLDGEVAAAVLSAAEHTVLLWVDAVLA